MTVSIELTGRCALSMKLTSVVARRRRPPGVVCLVVGLAGAVGCGEEAVRELSAPATGVAYGARWLDTEVTRVAICRSDSNEGTCARLYFERDPATEGWTPSVGQLGTSGPCRRGAIAPSAPSLVLRDGQATAFGPQGSFPLDLRAVTPAGRVVAFEGTVRMDEGPCP